MSTSIMAQLERACRFADRGDTVSVVGTLHVAMDQLAALDQQLAALREAASLLANTVALLNSMALSGESHSATSTRIVSESMAKYRALLAPPAGGGEE